jgi:hypothetical protein
MGGGSGRLHNEERHDFCGSQNVITVVKLRRMTCGHLARIGVMRNSYKILLEKPKDLGTGGRIMLA